MIKPVPDVTRLLDRLEAAGFVVRARSDDRSTVRHGADHRGGPRPAGGAGRADPADARRTARTHVALRPRSAGRPAGGGPDAAADPVLFSPDACYHTHGGSCSVTRRRYRDERHTDDYTDGHEMADRSGAHAGRVHREAHDVLEGPRPLRSRSTAPCGSTPTETSVTRASRSSSTRPASTPARRIGTSTCAPPTSWTWRSTRSSAFESTSVEARRRRRVHGHGRSHDSRRDPPGRTRRRALRPGDGSVGQRAHRVQRLDRRSIAATSTSRGTRRSRRAACWSATR